MVFTHFALGLLIGINLVFYEIDVFAMALVLPSRSRCSWNVGGVCQRMIDFFLRTGPERTCFSHCRLTTRKPNRK